MRSEMIEISKRKFWRESISTAKEDSMLNNMNLLLKKEDHFKKLKVQENEQKLRSNLDSSAPLNYWSSEEERREDALAPGADEGRDKLRKAAVRSKYPMSRRYPNGGTRLRKAQSLLHESIV